MAPVKNSRRLELSRTLGCNQGTESDDYDDDDNVHQHTDDHDDKDDDDDDDYAVHDHQHTDVHDMHDICPFFSTDTIFLHTKARKSGQKISTK